MWKYALLISYQGTDYCGWQRQKGSAANGKTSVQATVEAGVQRITGELPSVVGSGRTDSGVHACGQMAHFVLKEKECRPDILLNGLNAVLPPSIRVRSARQVALDFHAQRSAIKKQYSYYFQQGPCPLPHLLPFSWWIRKRLNLDAMREALDTLRGRHDFKPFQASGARPGPTVREIFEAAVTFDPVPFPGGLDDPEERVGLVRVRLVGSGFLKQMVRGIAGTLLQIGENRRSPACMAEILAKLDRKLVGPTAPGRALWLERVWYP